MANLAGRLQLLRETSRPPVARKPETLRKGDQFLPGWNEIAPLVWFRETVRNLNLGAETLSFTGVLLSPDTDPRSLLFFDTETTGLSTGAGTIPFLVSFGSQGDNGFFSVRQYFLADYPGEPEFLTMIGRELAEGKTLVSYNGRNFDAPLLRSRFLLSRIPFPQLPHCDLLYPARRFWKRVLPGCSLSEMERSVLFKGRELDIPGAEAPEIWFRFIRGEEEPRLAALMAHNLEDTVSLAELLTIMEALPERLQAKPLSFLIDRTGLALHLMKQEDYRGRELLERTAEEGDPHALRILSLLFRREGRWDEAAACWERLNTPGPSLFASVELAKYCEHRLRDYKRAAGYVREVLTAGLPLSDVVKEALRKRLERVEGRWSALGKCD